MRPHGLLVLEARWFPSIVAQSLHVLNLDLGLNQASLGAPS